MKTLLEIGCMMFVFSAAVAQPLTPLFTMPIWFEDAVGNRDTLWVGSDTAASSSQINPQFGEVEITAPFDSVFEVRGVHGSDGYWHTTKTIIEYTSGSGSCMLPNDTRIMIHALHWPVSIEWDTLLLKQLSPCHENVILTPTSQVFLLQNWYDAEPIYCMMTRDSLSEDFLYNPPVMLEFTHLKHSFEVQGQGLKEIKGLYYTGFYDYPYCYTLLDASAPTQASSSVWMYPNPSSDGKATVAFSHPEWVEEVTLTEAATGKMLQVPLQTFSERWQLPSSTPGVHFLTVRFKDGSRTVRKLVVY